MSVYGELLQQFQSDVQLRASREKQFAQLSSGPSSHEREVQRQLDSKTQLARQQLYELESEYEQARAAACRLHEEQRNSIQAAHQNVLDSIFAEFHRAQNQLQQQHHDSEWVVTSVLDDTAEDSPVRELNKAEAILERTREEQLALLESVRTSASQLFQNRGRTGAAANSADEMPRDRETAQLAFQTEVGAATKNAQAIQSLWLPKLYSGFRGLILFVGLALGIHIFVFLFVDPQLFNLVGPQQQQSWMIISAATGVLSGLLLTGFLYLVGSTRESGLLAELQQAWGNAEAIHHQWLKLADEEFALQKKRFAARQRRVEQERQTALERYESALQEQLQTHENVRDTKLRHERERFGLELAQQTAIRERALNELDADYNGRIEQMKHQTQAETQALEDQLQQCRSHSRRAQTELWSLLKSEWDDSSRLFLDAVNAIESLSAEQNPPWDQIKPSTWQPAATIPSGIQFGLHQVELHDWPEAVSNDMRLAPRRSSFTIPSQPEFPGSASTLFFSTDPAARQQAHQALQSMMLRLLLTIPPGKLRFTMIDPIGLGETFGGFMHLADYDELMVNNRIWTESNQIESRLADLTEHMENVFQTYLRNEFQTIEEYNESAGEVAEPYHFLVISDFPSKFSEIAARRLISIVNSGPRCGVYTLLNADPTKQLPNNFELSDIESQMTCYQWRESHFHAAETSLAPWPITIDPPPGPEIFTALVKMVGEASQDARRVEVAFDRIVPAKSEFWQRDSRSELEIPLGRSGATKLQRLKLGRGTSQHMLVAGKTGSGKSTFLHILITNLALHYDPNEVNFFLIDFKKGVEFKDYATYHLPHARVIAIESDREFGVSALQRLDVILQERGELFRRHGVQDIAAFRNANPDQPMPRILLVVDEFQEFFVEDDKLSQTAALLLDRLVRQGRAFGIHVVLGSQTLGGAYSLARTTLGQVAVRVALQCSETDAHLILSEENTAARLLTRPGEAIYNDANGMLEGNHPFQIAWIGDDERSIWLKQIEQKSARAGLDVEPPIVFEGNIPSVLEHNSRLLKLARECAGRETSLAAPTVWLGDAVEIQPATELTFHRQSGSHLLIVGQDAEAALGIMLASALGVAASATSKSTPIRIWDGSPAETSDAEKWKAFSESLPLDVRITAPRNVAEALSELTAELNARMDHPDSNHDSIVIFIHNIAKFRDLRKSDDDFGFSSFNSSENAKPAEPGKQFSTLLAEGPLVGMHFVIWCDSSNNFDRWFSRQSQKELEQRVVFQMNAADSSQLIDSPAASRLGTHRALLYREETGLAEKFRPYGPPSDTFLRDFGQLLKTGQQSEFATDLEEFSIL